MEGFDVVARLIISAEGREPMERGRSTAKNRDANRPMEAQPRSLLDPTSSLGLAT
jgi:hypothetical protein